MKLKCKVCRKETEINELDYHPGDKIVVECARCGNELEVVIPLRDDEEKMRPRVRVESKDSIRNEVDGCTVIPLAKDTASNDSDQNRIAEVNENSTPKPTYTLGNAVDIVSKDSQQSYGKLIAGVILGIAVVVGGFIWLNKGVSHSYSSNSIIVQDEAVADSSEIMPVETVYTTIEEVEEPTDTEVMLNMDVYSEVRADAVVEKEGETDVVRVFIPNASSSSSSEAYDDYATFLTGEKFGDGWAATSIVQDAFNSGMVQYFLKGVGDIEGYPLSIDAVRLKNGRLYGRYHNDYNGVKLDINGAYDADENLIIKLGHKSETSYWVLKYEGSDSDGNLLYHGTWGRKDKPTSLKISIRDK